MKHVAIAVDGPAGAGKSTIVKILAAKLRFKYIDTGAMYRAVALKVINSGFDTNNTSEVLTILDNLNMKIKFNNLDQIVYIDDINVTDKIRTPEVSQGASNVAKILEVRQKLVQIQKELAQNEDVIMDGRDIGKSVLPNAKVKIFLTASVEERAKRRYDELIKKGHNTTFEEVKKDMEYRDFIDSNREIDPLKPSEDSILFDTSNMSIEQVVDELTNIINKVK